MEKPSTMTVKEWIIKKMAISMVVSEKIIDAVVTHQFDAANDALDLNESVEISGFGKFLFNTKKAHTHYTKLLQMKQAYENTLADPDITEKKKHSTQLRLNTVLIDIKILKPKIHESKSDI
jgi:nucleoid DNA-binding protein